MQGVNQLLEALTTDRSHAPSDWLRAMLSAFKQLTGLAPIAGRGDLSRHPTTSKCLDAYALAVDTNAPFTDILGHCYMELAGRWKQTALGQFFTPQSLAVMMVSMYGGRSASAGGLTTVIDPACGSGCMLLSYMQVIHRMGQPGELKEFLFAGVDIDPLCADMTAVQILANGNLHQLEVGELVVVCGDSLTPGSQWRSVVHATAKDRKVTVDLTAAAFQEAVSKSAVKSDQLTLFGEAA